MARGKTLGQLRTALRAECRLSDNPAHNLQVLNQQTYLLQREQEALYDEFNWPHLRVERQVPTQAGQRYMAPPDELTIDRIERVEFKYGNEWCKLAYGIGAPQYSVWNSDLDIRSWPVTRWRIWEDEQIEMWPIPANNQDPNLVEGIYKFIGIRKLRPLVADSDRAELDDQLIVLPAAIKFLVGAGKPEAKLLIQQLERRVLQLRGQLSKRQRFQLFGQAGGSGMHLRGPDRVQYRIETRR